jgi:hypothetical protein
MTGAIPGHPAPVPCDLCLAPVLAAARLGVNLVKPTTLIGVAALAERDLLVEVEAIAVLS